MIYPIVMYGDPVLRQRAKDIEPGTDLQPLVDDMFETMHAANGVGLAAPQIGKSIRLFVIDGDLERPQKSVVLVGEGKLLGLAGLSNEERRGHGG